MGALLTRRAVGISIANSPLNPGRPRTRGHKAFLLFAISAELIDAKLKQNEDLKQEATNQKQEAVNQQLLHPIRSVTAHLELFIPEAVLLDRKSVV